MKFLVDMNLSPRWVAWLGERGHHADHWSEVGAATAADSQIMDHALEAGAVVLTSDLDFGPCSLPVVTLGPA